MSAIVCVTSYGFGTNGPTVPACLGAAFPDVRMTWNIGIFIMKYFSQLDSVERAGVWISENTRSTGSPDLIYVSASSARSASV
jgi:hypothetical protein